MVLACCMLSCSPSPESSPKEHAFSEEEQVKLRLDEAASALVEAAGLQSADDIVPFLVLNSGFSLPRGEGLKYSVRRDGTTLLTVSVLISIKDGSAALHLSHAGGMSIDGTMGASALSLLTTLVVDYEPSAYISLIDSVNKDISLVVSLDGDPVATVSLEPLHHYGAGEDRWVPLPVIRFPDGTSYSFTALLLVGPVLDMAFNEKE